MSDILPERVATALGADAASAARVWQMLPEPQAPPPDASARARVWTAVAASIEAGTPASVLPPSVAAGLDAAEQDDAARVWAALPEPPAPTPSADARARTWNAVAQTIRQDVRPARPRADRAPHRRAPHRRASRTRLPVWIGALATLTIVAVAGLFLLRPNATVYTAGATERVVELPDGSTVTLEPGATLTQQAWGDARPLTLDGTAFFEVASDQDRPMHISTPEATVTVLGTSFTVAATPEQTAVRVASGRVAVADARGALVAELVRGDVARVTSARRVVNRATHSFDVQDVALGALLDDVERTFGIVIAAEAGVRAERITFTQHNAPSAASVLESVGAAKGLRYRETAQGFELYRP